MQALWRSAPTSDVFMILLLFPETGKLGSQVTWDLVRMRLLKDI